MTRFALLTRLPQLALALVPLYLAVTACGDDGDGSSNGTAGTGGSAGSTGSGGSSGSGGSAGRGGSQSGGSSGSGGSKASGGSAGTSSSQGGSSGAGAGQGGSANAGASGEGGAGGTPSGGPNLAFVTSSGFTPQALGGLAGADEKCQMVAQNAGLEGTFVAWLSDSTTDARDRLGNARGWVRLDGKPFADRVEDIAAGLHFYPLNITQGGTLLTSQVVPVITGTGADGRKSAPFGDYCQNYSGANAEYGVVHGDVNYADDRWTIMGEQAGDLLACNSAGRLYCFQIDYDSPVDASFPPSRKAFVTSAAVRPDMGRDAFDARCAQDAENAGLDGTFLAFVSTNSQSAASRFDLTGPTYARVDGVPIVSQAADLATAATLETPINLHANGSMVGAPNRLVFTGSASPSMTSTGATSCANWSTTNYDNLAQIGDPGSYGTNWWNDRTDWHCNTFLKVYCLEQ